MVDIAALKGLPDDKEVAIGVLDIRTSMIESRKRRPSRMMPSTPGRLSPATVELAPVCGSTRFRAPWLLCATTRVAPSAVMPKPRWRPGS